MSNGYLCIGGPCDGTYFDIQKELQHGETIFVRQQVPFTQQTGPDEYALTTRETSQPYQAWSWFQGSDRRARVYLIPIGWDGFEAMDWLERKAYGRITFEEFIKRERK